jgi:hypothetical protein
MRRRLVGYWLNPAMMAAALFLVPGLKAGSLDLVANPVQSLRDDLQNHGIAIGMEWDADVFVNVRGVKNRELLPMDFCG